jgi:hypothetical protein
LFIVYFAIKRYNYYDLLLSLERSWDTDPGFFKALGSHEPIKTAEEAGDDTEFERKAADSVKLYR